MSPTPKAPKTTAPIVAPTTQATPEFPVRDPNAKGGENNPLTEADSLADLMGEPRPSQVAPIPGTMQVKIKLLSDSARVPTYGTDGAACFDLYAADTVAVAPGRKVTVKTDVAFEVPEGYVLMIYSRSGHGSKNGVRLANGTGVVDSDYRGHVLVCLHNDGNRPFIVELGDRVAQAMIVPVPRVEFLVVDELSETVRGEAGFGSTGA